MRIKGNHYKPGERFIAKVQLSFPESLVLVYDERRIVWHEEEATDEIRALMRGERKAYVWCYIDDQKRLHLDEMADEQDW